jgi:DNA-binding GntR family transcriptional regulator
VNTPGTDDDQVAQSVYDRIKARLLEQILAPKHLLQIGKLADELGASTTPVREALIRLASERLIVYSPKKGFFAKTTSEDELRGLYFVNLTLLKSALSGTQGPDAVSREGSRPRLEIAGEQAVLEDAVFLVKRTADLFLHVAVQSGVNELAEIVRNINDRLHHPRLIEHEFIGDSRKELADLYALYIEGTNEELLQAIQSYHQKRLRHTALICKELLFRPFAVGKRQSVAQPDE